MQSLSILATLEIVTIVWIFGARPFRWLWYISTCKNSFSREISRVTGQEVPKILLCMWLFVTPVIVIVIMIFSLAGYKPLQYIDYVYPAWANAIGWCIASLSLICVPLGKKIFDNVFYIDSFQVLSMRCPASMIQNRFWSASNTLCAQRYPSTRIWICSIRIRAMRSPTHR